MKKNWVALMNLMLEMLVQVTRLKKKQQKEKNVNAS